MDDNRPFVVTGSNENILGSPRGSEPALGEGGSSRQQSELQPGEIRRPGVLPPTPLMDWGRGDSLMWDSQFGSENPTNLSSTGGGGGGAGGGSPATGSPQTVNTQVPSTTTQAAAAVVLSPTTSVEPTGTPLTGYGRGDNLWGRSPTSVEAPGGNSAGFPPGSNSGVNATSAASNPTATNGGNNNNNNNTDNKLEDGANGGSSSSAAAAGGNSARPTLVFQEPIHNAPDANAYPAPSAHAALGYQRQEDGMLANRQDGILRQESSSLSALRQDTSLLAFQFRTQSQILSDELYFQSMWFPPPPPPRVPKESRRARSELWYYYASKWDITHTQPPPPRCPLALMEEEHAQCLPPQSKVPYRGEYWLDRCNYWFSSVQENFIPPERHSPIIVDPNFVLERCLC